MEHHVQKNLTKKRYSKRVVCFFGMMGFLLKIMSGLIWPINCAQLKNTAMKKKSTFEFTIEPGIILIRGNSIQEENANSEPIEDSAKS